jgi:DedD protein
MSVRYTGEATMDGPVLRDMERWKDKIEVRLDNRQVFFLFFGSAMVACMLFVLGVIVGKRLETRGRADAPAVEDPLAVLDRLGGGLEPVPTAPALTFPQALITTTTPRGKASLAKPTMVTTAATTAPSSPPAAAAPAPSPSGGATDPASKRLAALPRVLSMSTPAASTKPAANGVPTLPVLIGDATAKESTRPTKSAGAAVSKPTVGLAAAAAADRGKTHFLLQLSSFPDRAEADAFARRFATQNAYVVATEIPGKGTWYRVRVGSYTSLQEATAAKTAFEHDHNVIAYVAGGGSPK